MTNPALKQTRATIIGQPNAARSHRRVTAYVPIAVVCAAVAVVGFWPTYFGRLFSGSLSFPSIIHFHAVIFSGWLCLLIVQVVLAASGRTALHMKLGTFGMIYGVAVIIVGEVTAFSVFGARVQAGDIARARAGLFAPVTDLLVFAPFLAAAWFYRRKPEIHKRLIVVATTILLIAPTHRGVNWIFGGPPPPVLPVLVVWLAPIILGLAFDFWRRRLVHPVYLVGIAAVLFLKFFRRPLAATDAWNGFVTWVTSLYL